MSRHTNLPDILVSHRDSCFVQADFLCCKDTVFHGLGLGFPVLLPSSLAASSGMAGDDSLCRGAAKVFALYKGLDIRLMR
jgi:hypothetical protein